MNTITTALKQFVNDEDGVTAIEYGLIAALVAAAIAATVGLLGTAVDGAFVTILDAIN